MKKRESLIPVFLFLLFLSVLVFGLSKIHALDFLGKLTLPVQSLTFNLLKSVNLGSSSIEAKLKEENLKLSKKLIDQKKLELEIKALHDQFEVITPRSAILLPANVAGARGFLPGISNPESFVIDKGLKDGVKKGDAVIFADNLVGKVVEASSYLSKVELITSPSSSFAAKTDFGVLGVVRGLGNGEMVLDNVLLSESLEPDNFVILSGDLNLEGRGFKEGLIVGKVTSVEKNPSELFQKGKLKSLIDISSLSKVFVITGIE